MTEPLDDDKAKIALLRNALSSLLGRVRDLSESNDALSDRLKRHEVQKDIDYARRVLDIT